MTPDKISTANGCVINTLIGVTIQNLANVGTGLITPNSIAEALLGSGFEFRNKAHKKSFWRKLHRAIDAYEEAGRIVTELQIVEKNISRVITIVSNEPEP